MKKIIIVEPEIHEKSKRNKLYAKIMGVLFGGGIFLGIVMKLLEAIKG